MIESWWQAHALEFALDAILIGVALCFLIPIGIAALVRERRQKRKDGLL